MGNIRFLRSNGNCEHCDEEEQEQEENECKHCRVEDVSYKGYCSRACYLYDNE